MSVIIEEKVILVPLYVNKVHISPMGPLSETVEM